jgi:signal transduction histidine kinase
METLWIFDSLRKRLQEWANSPDFIEKFLDEVLAFPLLEKMDRGSIFFYDQKTDQMVLVAARSGNGLDLVGLTRSLGEGVAGYVAQEKKPLLVVSREATPAPAASLDGKYDTDSFICAPILNSGRLIGVLNLTEKKSKKPFNETDLHIVTKILGEFSANIEQAFYQRDLHNRIRTLERKAGMGEMVEGVAHEINSALDGTMRFINMGLKRAEDGGDGILCEWLQDAKTGLERICRIVKPVNQYTRNGTKTFREININGLLQYVLKLMSHALNSHEVVTRLDPGLPNVNARSDLDQVFLNLIKNAVEAMAPGGTLEISTGFDKKNVFIQVRDTGCGIPKAVLSKLGERGVTTKNDGNGMGISIVREIIKEHDGELKVESTVGVGSTFTVRLPLKKKKGN